MKKLVTALLLVLATVTNTHLATPASRADDDRHTYLWNGETYPGLSIITKHYSDGGTYNCTLGWMLRRTNGSTTNYAITAGHCYKGEEYVYAVDSTGQEYRIGRWVTHTYNDDTDAGIMEILGPMDPTAFHIHSNNTAVTLTSDNIGELEEHHFDTTQIWTAGGHSTVISSGKLAYDSEDDGVHSNFIQFEGPNVHSIKGDSGGPVWTRWLDGKLAALGIFVAVDPADELYRAFMIASYIAENGFGVADF